MHYKNYFWIKVAFALFITSFAITSMSVLLLYQIAKQETQKVNVQINTDNLAVTQRNIEEKIHAIENSSVSIFFDKTVKEGILNSRQANDEVLLYNQTYSNFLRVLNTTPDIAHLIIYTKSGFSISTLSPNMTPFNSYQNCSDYFQNAESFFDTLDTAQIWFSYSGVDAFAHTENWLINVRTLRDSSKEPMAFMLVFIKETSFAKLYTFFGDDSYIVDENEKVISASKKEMIGTYIATPEKAIKVQLPSINATLITSANLNPLQALQNNIFTTMLLLIAFCAIFSSVAAIVISKGLTHPIGVLKNVMETARDHHFHEKYMGQQTDEIGYLGCAFNSMMDDINLYVREIEESERRGKENELRFLQAQINPHLLYNTLGTAQYYVSRCDNEKAAKILEHLGNYFKSSLQQGRTFVCLWQEIENIEDYLTLQRLCRGVQVELRLNISQELFGRPILRISLQPIVENACIHAFIGGLGAESVLCIEGRQTEQNEIVLTITDNGIGMTEEVLAQLRKNIVSLFPPEKGFGLWNVNSRLKTYYGEQYGLHIESEFGEYTKLTLKIGKEECRNV